MAHQLDIQLRACCFVDGGQEFQVLRSCSLGLSAPRNLPATPSATWEPEDLGSFTGAADFHTEPYAPTVTVRGRTGSNAGIKRHVAVLTLGQMHGLQIPRSTTRGCSTPTG